MKHFQNSHVTNCWERRQPSCFIHELVTDNLIPCNSSLAIAAGWSHLAFASSIHSTKAVPQKCRERRQPSCLIYELVTDNLNPCNSTILPYIFNYCRSPLRRLDPSFCLVDFTRPFSSLLLCLALPIEQKFILMVGSTMKFSSIKGLILL
jgi:hypothetical protein